MSQSSHHEPLASRMRPHNLDDVVGQDHLLKPGSALRRLVENDEGNSVFLWGPPGTGKTTLAHVVATSTSQRFVELSAVSATIKDVRAAIENAQKELNDNDISTVLFIDEIHRFSKTQQDALLPAVEKKVITLIAATTENPAFSVVAPLLSRSLLLTLQPLDEHATASLIDRARVHPEGLNNRVTITDGARSDLVRLAGGDARKALTYLEQAAASAESTGHTEITSEIVAEAFDKAVARYDRSGDQHYDIISAFIKSMRGSDPDAAVHWLARMVDAGEDPRFIARRLVIHASEDVGLADSSVLHTCIAAAHAVHMVGLPEAGINLAHAAIAVALAPKSNQVIAAWNSAMDDVKNGHTGEVPMHLRDAHYSSAHQYGHGINYLYPHDYPHGAIQQDYLPENMNGTIYYRPTDNGTEKSIHIEQLQRKIAGVENRIALNQSPRDDGE